ncbi:hypothetical protein [Nitrosospira sp. Nsp2]|uniref:hypothetical protein n=1 Tax=Nitrosospira sp. Nsp2 TaxID=136548 RepID=UPI0015E7B47A|nr:hypothetical protein [Nitrosospira sp. Nsp2]
MSSSRPEGTVALPAESLGNASMSDEGQEGRRSVRFTIQQKTVLAYGSRHPQSNVD